MSPRTIMRRVDPARVRRAVLRCGAAAVLVCSMPGAASGQATRYTALNEQLRPDTASIEYVMLLDRSGSMRPLWNDVVARVSEFVGTLGRGSITIVGFDGTAAPIISVDQINASSQGKVEAALRSLGAPAGVHTNIVNAVDEACKRLTLSGAGGIHAAVFITDGSHDPGPKGAVASTASAQNACSKAAQGASVEFMAVGIRPGLDLSIFSILLHTQDPWILTAAPSELNSVLSVLKLRALAKHDLARAATYGAAITVDSLVPTRMRGGDSAVVHAYSRSPFNALRGCPTSIESHSATEAFSVVRARVDTECLAPGAEASTWIVVRATPPSGLLPRVWDRVRPKGLLPADMPLAATIGWAVDPQTRAELGRLGITIPAARAQELNIPVVLLSGVAIWVYLVAGLLLVILGLRARKPRVWGELRIQGSETRFEDGSQTLSLGSLDADRATVRLPGGAAIDIVARKVHPLGYDRFNSSVGVAETDDGVVRVRLPEGAEELRTGHIVWLVPDSEIEIHGAGSTGSPVKVVWN